MKLDCSHNRLKILNVSNNLLLEYLDCSNNLLTSLDLSRDTLLMCIRIAHLPILQEVYVWTLPFPPPGVEVKKGGSPYVCFTCNVTIGMTEYIQEELSIYPNPTNGILTIESINSRLYSIEITSLNGQLIYKTVMDGTTHQIELSSFQTGTYFITFRSKNFVTTRKIIKL